ALLMKVFCWLSPDDLRPGLVTALAEKEAAGGFNGPEILEPVPDALWALARDASRVDQAFADLRDRSLLDHDEGDRWRLHRLTQEVQRSLLIDVSMGSAQGEDLGPRATTHRGPGSGPGPSQEGSNGRGSSPGPSQDEAESKRAFAEASAAFVFNDDPDWRAVAAAMVAAGYPGGENNSPVLRHNWPICARLNPHVAALMRDPPATAAMDYLLNQASGYLDAQRQDDLALSYAQKSLDLKIARLGETHETIGTAYSNLSGQLWRLGRLEEAEQHAARAVEISEGLEDRDEAFFSVALSNHGLMANHLSRRLEGAEREQMLALAQRRYDQALEIDGRLHRRESAEVATRLTNLADLWSWQGLWEKALAASGEALSTLRKVLFAGDPLLALGLNNLGSYLLQSGRIRVEGSSERALDLLEQALAIREDAFADLPRHPDRVNTADWLAAAHWCFEALGEDGAEPTRAAALCREYDLDLERQENLGLDYAARAIAWRERGEEPLGQMQILDAQRAAASSHTDGSGADSTA
ncbi:MAG: tetratricopeptide repeat protein, partial [Pseudomonadota bacterium]